MSIDPRIQNLSYSSLLTLHSCPRKFQLDKLTNLSEYSIDTEESITFSYGHLVGHGIQQLLQHIPYEQIMWELFIMWKPDLWAENTKQRKSFAEAVYAIQKFQALISGGFLENYELVHYQDKPACELSFIVSLPNGFKYRGFVDAVLQHKITKEVIVLECKTSSALTVNPATYKNSAQAIGYSIVLDAIFPELSSYSVIYLIYYTKTLSYEQLRFTKSFLQRARWIRELMLDIDTITNYESHSLYPMHGESCFSYFRECKYMGLCHMDSWGTGVPLTPDELTKLQEDHTQFQIQISIEDLITKQLSKAV